MSSALSSFPNTLTHPIKLFDNTKVKQHLEQLLVQQQQEEEEEDEDEDEDEEEEEEDVTPHLPVISDVQRQNQPNGDNLFVAELFVKPCSVTNILRFVKAVTPFIPVELCSGQENNDNKTSEVEQCFFYSLSGLWKAFIKWSCYGVGVPTLLNEKEHITQFYVPYLSAIQLYVDPFLSEKKGYGNSLQMSEFLVNDMYTNVEIDGSNSLETLIYEYFEKETPRNRMPLTNKALSLAQQFPELNTIKSCDLSPASWISVAWYPIWREPLGSTLERIDACFLTYHSLSTHSTRYSTIKVNDGMKGGKSDDIGHRKLRIPLPVFGVVCNKYKGTLLCPNKNHECKKENSLIQAAEDWIRDRKILHPDYELFLSHQ